MKKIAVSLTSFCSYCDKPLITLLSSGYLISKNEIGQKVSKQQLVELTSEAIGLIAGTETIDMETLRHLPSLRVISRCGAGIDNIDLEATGKLGIQVLNTPDAPTLAVAELTVALMLSLMRKIPLADRTLKDNIWQKPMGNLLQGKKVGIIGFGRIGQKVAQLLAPFGVELAYYDPQEKCTNIPCQPKPFNEFLEWADIISLHCSTTGSGKPVLGEKELMQLKEGAWVLNLSRGGLVDEGALFNALHSGHLSGAALDVFEREPYQGPLIELDNVILTPHIGSYARESRIAMEMKAVNNLLAALEEIK